MLRACFGVVAVLALAGCSPTTSSPAPKAEAGPPPVNYKAAALASVRETYFDPYSVRDASISLPLYATAVFDGLSMAPSKGWVVCVKSNAKNRMGAYTGVSPTLMLFQGETVTKSLSGPDFAGQVADHCKTAVYEPFPELEGA